MLIIPPMAAAMGVVAANPVGIPHVERLLIVAVSSSLAAYTIVGLVGRRWSFAPFAVRAAFLCLTAFWFGGMLTRRLGRIRGLVLVALLLALSILVLKVFRDSRIPGAIVSLVGIVLLVGPAAEGIESLTGFGESTVGVSAPLELDVTNPKDVWLVVFDGHPGLRAIEQDFAPGSVADLQERLGSAGYQLPRSVWTAYWATDWSVPSLLDMGYPTSEADMSDATINDLYAMIGGENRLVDALDRSGYETFMVESGWSGGSCGSAYDHCVTSPWLDEAMYLMLANSLVGEAVFQNFGYAFNAGAVASMEWLLGNSTEIAGDDRASLVFAHVMAPHPPYFLDRNCSTTVDPTRYGVTFHFGDVPAAERQSLLEDTMTCLSTFMTYLRGAVGEEAMVILVSDHGTDRREQLITDADTWGEAGIRERMNAFLAVSTPGCDLGDQLVLPNVMRRVLSCLGAEPIPDVADRMFIDTGNELPADTVARLVGSP